MKARLKENAPFPTQKLKRGVVLNKEEWTTIDDTAIQNQIVNQLGKIVEVSGKGIPKKKRVLKVVEDEPIEKDATIIVKENKKEEKTLGEIESLLDEGNTTKVLKSEIKRLLKEKLKYTEEDLKSLNKSKLVDIYKIEKL